jgi:hypothetical protein
MELLTHIGIKDKNNQEIHEHQEVEIKVQTWNGSYHTICKGKIQFVSEDLSSHGCGYAVVEKNGKKTFLSSVSKSNTDIEIVSE